MKEVSVGCSMGGCSCSICGKDLKFDYRTWTHQCENEHMKGEKYDGKVCVGELIDPKDAYEFSLLQYPPKRKPVSLKARTTSRMRLKFSRPLTLAM